MTTPRCPYCQDTPTVLPVLGSGYRWTVKCAKPMDHAVAVIGASPEDAVAKWRAAYDARRPLWRRLFWK
jgi:hypothetical protein